MKPNIFIGLALVYLFFNSKNADAQFALTGEIRPRTELSHGYKSLASEGQKASIFTTQRTRLNLNYNNENKLKFKLTLQDVRLWGNQPQLVSNEDFATSVHEAWAEVNLASNLSLKLGRQEVVYDDHRIFGNVGWAQQARSHDLALLKFENNSKIHIGLAYHENSNRTNNLYLGPDAYKTLQFLWFNHQFSQFTLSVLALNNGVPFNKETDAFGNVTKQAIVYSQTIGSRAVLDLNGTKISSNIYLQTGDILWNNAETNLNALNFLLEISQTLGKAVLNPGYEYLSGTDYNKEAKSFTPFYGTNHKFNGSMDYFFVGNHINSVGLHDIYLKSGFGLGKGKLIAHVHLFAAAAEISPNTDKYLGTEIDLGYSIKINDNSSLGVGYSQMIASDAMEVLKGGSKDEFNNWAYIMFTFTPTFLNIDNSKED